MKAESINSNECVEDPRTSESMRIQPISKTNEAAPVRSATARKNLKGAASSESRPPRGRAFIGSSVPPANSHTAAARPRLRAPALCTVPGSPSLSIMTNPLASTPIEAPKLLVKYSIASDSPGAAG